ncbi:MAG: hypothetical protein ACO4AV_05865 [bacterium]
MKKFITTLAAALVIGSAASAATFVEVFRIDGERYMIKVPATNVLQQVVDTHAIPTAGGTYSTLVADTHAIPTAGGTYDVGSSTTVANYNWEALPDSEHLTIDAAPFAEEIVGGLGPQLPYDPMRGVDYGFVQALLQQNVDPFSEEVVGGLGPQPFNAVTYSEVFVDGQIHIITATDVETFSVAGN